MGDLWKRGPLVLMLEDEHEIVELHRRKKWHMPKGRHCLGDSKEVGLYEGTDGDGWGQCGAAASAPFCVLYVLPCCHVA